MIVFPKSKINLGLRITGKRDDGYHNIETIFYPVGLRDALEFVVSEELQEKACRKAGSLNVVVCVIRCRCGDESD